MRTLDITKIVSGIVLACFLSVAAPSTVSAQDTERPNIVLDIVKSVVLDPTTYTPAALSYTSQRMDWNTSQPLFRAGWVEHNRLYTLSGRPDDTPVSYEVGNRMIRRVALVHLEESLVNNVATQVFERALTTRYPQHRKLFKVLGWVERIGFSGYVGYLASVNHFQQVQRNQELARVNGLE